VTSPQHEASPAQVRVGWQNALLAATALLNAAVTILLTVGLALPVTGTVPRIAIVAAGIVVALGVTVVAVRCGRLSVYAGADGLRIRGVLRTRVVPWKTIVTTTVRRRTNMKGATYYMPALVVRLPERIDRHALVVLPPDQRPIEYWYIGLIWLAAATEKTARRRAEQVASMFPTASSTTSA
jgi:hypothetical protein